VTLPRLDKAAGVRLVQGVGPMETVANVYPVDTRAAPGVDFAARLSLQKHRREARKPCSFLADCVEGQSPCGASGDAKKLALLLPAGEMTSTPCARR